MSNTITGTNGKDKLIGTNGEDEIFGLDGNDKIDGKDGNDVLHGGDGKDNLKGGKGEDTLFGDDGNDNLKGDDGNDVLHGGDGKDNLKGGKGDDTLFGDDGNDKLKGDDGDDVLHGGEGNDDLKGGKGEDMLFGDAGNDKLKGDKGDDHLNGGSGNDDIDAGNGDDTVTHNVDENQGTWDDAKGGSGWDTLVVEVTAAQFAEIDATTLEADFAATNANHKFDFSDYEIFLTFDLGLEVKQFEELVFEVAPDAMDDAVMVNEDDLTNMLMGDINVLDNDVDANMDMLSVLEVNGLEANVGVAIVGMYGTLTMQANGMYTYEVDNLNPTIDVLDDGDMISESFSYTVTDDYGLTDMATLEVTIKGANDAPVAAMDTGMTDQDNSVTIDVLANDTDVDGDDNPGNFSLDAVSVPAGMGTVSMMGNQLKFNPGTDFDDLDAGDSTTVTVNYTMSDDSGAPSMSSVDITVTGTNDNPVAAMDTGMTDEDNSVTIDVLANDTDVDGDDNPANFSLDAVSVPAGMGTVSMMGNQLKFDPGTDFDYLDDTESVIVTVDYTMSDDSGATSMSSVDITVTGVTDNMPPTAFADTFMTDDTIDTMAVPSWNILMNDMDPDMGDTKTLTAVTNMAIMIPALLDTVGDLTIVEDTGPFAAGIFTQYTITASGELANEVTLGGMEMDAKLIIKVDGSVELVKNNAFDFISDTEEIVITFDYTMEDSFMEPSSSDVTITIDGTDNQDVFVADAAGAFIEGGLESDVLLGDVGDDYLYGEVEANNGTIETAGHDILNGGAGDDKLYGDARSNSGTIETAGNDILDGGDGNDDLFGDIRINNGTLTNAGDDTLDGGAGDDDLYGDVRFGNSALVGGDDMLDGGADTDTAHYLSTNVLGFDYNWIAGVAGPGVQFSMMDTDATDSGIEGTDTLVNIEKIQFGNTGPTYNLVLGDDGGNSLTGTIDGGGNHEMNLILGFSNVFGDILIGDIDDNQGTISTSNDILIGGDGGDNIFGDAQKNSDTITTAGNDILVGNEGIDVIVGDVGTNQGGIITTTGNDTLYGNDGGDFIYGDIDSNVGTAVTSGNDQLFGGLGEDLLVGDVNKNQGFLTNAGHDTLEGGAGDDDLFGDVRQGNSALVGGDDMLDGGADIDTAHYLSTNALGFDYNWIAGVAGPGVQFSMMDTDATDSGIEGTDTLVNIEKIDFGGTTYDLVLGDDMGNFIVGSETSAAAVGNMDLLLGFNGWDIIVGDVLDNVFIIPNGGDDVLIGGAGNDQLFGEVTKNFGTITTAGHDTLDGGIEDDILVGEVGQNFVTIDTAGNDILNGGDGSDILVGDVSFNDGGTITTAGDDLLKGGLGNDTLVGDVSTNSGIITTFGTDTAVFDSTSALGFTYVFAGVDAVDGSNTFTMEDTDFTDGFDEGTDTLRQMDLVRFDDSGTSETYNLVVGDNGNNDIVPLVGTIGTMDLILGFDGADDLIGDTDTNSAGSTISTMDDILIGGDGSAFMWGDVVFNADTATITSAGNDILIGGTGTETLYGDVGTNNGTIDTAGNDILDGGDGNDDLFGDVRDNSGTITNAGDDTLDGGAGDDDLYGDVRFGNSALVGGDDMLDGGADTDTAHYLSTNVLGFDYNWIAGVAGPGVQFSMMDTDATDSGIEGTDTLVNIEKIQFGNNGPTYNLVLGDDGADGTFAAPIEGTMTGLVHDMNLFLGFSAVDVLTGDVNNNAFGSSIDTADDVLIGGAGNDDLFGDVRDNNGTITDAGNDILDGGTGHDYLYGDVENNGGTIDTAGDDLLIGGTGFDRLYGDVRDNSLILTNAGHDTLEGGEGDDDLYGDVAIGNSALVGGDDMLDGGADTDTAHYLSTNVLGFAYAYGGSATKFTMEDIDTLDGGIEGTDTLVNIEKIDFGGTTYDLVLGDDINQTFSNPLEGTMTGAVHDMNLILGFEGNDILIGDVFENNVIITTTGDDVLIGGGGGDSLSGDARESNGTIITSGNDTLDGGLGNDILVGDVNNNDATLFNAGNDLLIGGAGNDDLYGDVRSGLADVENTGSDTFFFDLNSPIGLDEIFDFNAAGTESTGLDTLEFSGVGGTTALDFDNFLSPSGSIEDVGDDVVIDIDGSGNSITIYDVGIGHADSVISTDDLMTIYDVNVVVS